MSYKSSLLGDDNIGYVPMSFDFVYEGIKYDNLRGLAHTKITATLFVLFLSKNL